MKPGKKILIGFFTFLLFSGCSILGLHYKVSNPKNAGSYPKITRSQLLLAKQTNRRASFDVRYYRLNINLASKKHLTSGEVLIRSVLLNKADTIQIDLYKNLKINAITCDHQKAAYRREEGAIFIKVPEYLKPGALFDLTVNYEGKVIKARHAPWVGGLTWKKDKQNNLWAGVTCETEGASIWWPNKDDVSDEADSVDLAFTVPIKSELVSNGIYRNTTLNKDHTKAVHWHVSYPINNYNVTFYIGKFKLIADTFVSKQSNSEIPLSYYVLDKHYSTAKKHFQQVKQQLAFYESVFGNYPWPKDGFKLIESPYEGMEHQTAIAYGNSFKNNSYGFDYIILHESAHEWWGNSVTAADLSDVWLQEGFATYAEALYVEATHGYEAYNNYMYWQRLTIKNKRPVVRPRDLRYFSSTDEDVYNKGAWVLHTLRNTIKNDTLFFDIIKTFRNENHMKQIFTETFIDVVNKKTGKDYNWFFKQYLYRREAPILEYYWVGDDFFYKWKNANNDFNKLPIELTFGKQKKVVIYPDTFIQKLVTNDADGTDVTFDEDGIYFGYKWNSRLVGE